MLAAVRAYAAHPDAATRAVNTVALIVGSNGPFYPAYVWFLAPEAGPAALLTMAASPFFLAVPWLARRSPAMARAALPLIGIANTVWTASLLGRGAGVEVFLFPCIVLALLCWRERRAMLAVLGTGLLAQQALLHWPWAPLAGLAQDHHAALAALNSVSVAALLAMIVLSSAAVLPVRRA